MLPNQSHAPTTTCLEKLDTAVKLVQTNLRDHILVDCHSHRLRKIAGHLDLLREVAEEIRREIADHLAGVPEIIPMLPNYDDPLDFGLPYAGQPFAVGSCDLAIHASANTSLDGERRCG